VENADQAQIFIVASLLYRGSDADQKDQREISVVDQRRISGYENNFIS